MKTGKTVKVAVDDVFKVIVRNSDSAKTLEKSQELQLAKKKEQYNELQPVGFEYAPESAVEYRETLKNDNNVERMEYLQKNVSYNADNTVNLLSLNKIFCENIGGKDEFSNYVDAQKLVEDTGYSLMSDYNDTDSEEEKKGSDLYKVINIFSGNNGDTAEGMRIFRDMLGCDSYYWTSTPYKDKYTELEEGFIRIRAGSWYDKKHFRDGSDGTCPDVYRGVCGLKDMVA